LKSQAEWRQPPSRGHLQPRSLKDHGMRALPKTGLRRSPGRNHQQTAIAGLLVAILALGMTVASVTQEWAMPAAERTSADAVVAAFAALGLAPAPPPAPAPVKTVTVAALPIAPVNDAPTARPQAEDKCNDFSFAFFSTQCVKVHKKHTSLRRHAGTTSFKPAPPPKPAAANERTPTTMRLAEDAKTSGPSAKSSPTVR
jgi:hypothetical protein